jgi:hypothetical protein
MLNRTDLHHSANVLKAHERIVLSNIKIGSVYVKQKSYAIISYCGVAHCCHSLTDCSRCIVRSSVVLSVVFISSSYNLF